MITYQIGSFTLVILILVICICFAATLIIWCINCYNKNYKTKTLVKDTTLLGVFLSLLISIFISGYGYSYYDHFHGLIEEYNHYQELLKDEKTDSGIVNVIDWYENKIQSFRETGQLTNFEEEVMRNNRNIEYKYELRYIFPFKLHNYIMFFSLYFTIVAGILFAIYIKPTKSAFENNHPQKNTVLWLNILLGWTVIGWLALLVWMNPGSAQPQREKAAPKQTQPSVPESAAEKLLQLKTLRDADAITQEEYEQKKQELLNQL